MAKKYIDYEFTPEVFFEQIDTDGKDKSIRAAAQIVFIASDGSRKHSIAGSGEAEMLMAEVRKNNPEAHGVALPKQAAAPVSENTAVTGSTEASKPQEPAKEPTAGALLEG